MHWVVSKYFSDLLVANVVIVELKVVIEIKDVFAAQCLGYLKVRDCQNAAVNFGKPRVAVERFRFWQSVFICVYLWPFPKKVRQTNEKRFQGP
ncbi:MAG: GxxExxY protein [Planctomycetota bacterium]